MTPSHNLVSFVTIDSVPFGCTQYELLDLLGEPDRVRENYNGEVEFFFGNAIYRCFHHYFVECTFPDTGRLTINGVEVLRVFEWLAAREDCRDIARFRVSTATGLAYDYRNPEHGSITVFKRGHWDELFR